MLYYKVLRPGWRGAGIGFPKQVAVIEEPVQHGGLGSRIKKIALANRETAALIPYHQDNVCMGVSAVFPLLGAR